MSISWNERCPVCGSITEQDSGSYACASCGFPYAHVAYFSGSRAAAAWTQTVQLEKANLLHKMVHLCAERPIFQMCGGRIVFTSPQNGQVSLVGANNVQPQPAEIRQYSSDENTRNEIFLYTDGHVTAKGENEYGQCNTRGLKQIRSVVASARGTYAITQEGRLERCGQTFPCNTQNIRVLCAGDNYLTVLTQDGRVQSPASVSEIRTQIQSWIGVTAIACTDNAVLALRQDGHVLFAGKQPNDPRAQAEKWSNIAAIAIEQNYAVGLTVDGQILLAGRTLNDFLDRGRRQAAEWTDIVSISCTSSGIAGLAMNGTIRLAGNIRDLDRLRSCWDRSFSASAHLQLLKAVNPTIETPKSFL